MKYLIVIAFLLVFINEVKSQNCKVLLKTINSSYTGDCKKGKAEGKGIAKGTDTYKGEFKKGLPNGMGVYTWSNGNEYNGEFKKGKKEGQGVLVYKRSITKDSIVKGFWKKDQYIGMFKKPYKKLDKSQNVNAISLNKAQDDIKSLRFYLKVDQKQILNPAVNVIVHSGQYQSQINNTNFVELTNVSFPIKLKVYFNQEYIELEIFQSGLWDIKTDITFIKGLGN